MSINSSDPFSTPLIDPGLLSNGVDIVILREAIRSARRFASAPAWSSYITGPSPTNNATTDADLEQYIRNNAVSFFHPVATSAMSPASADWGVVNPDLKVKNTLGLRIVDAGVIVSVLLFVGFGLIADCDFSHPYPLRTSVLMFTLSQKGQLTSFVRSMVYD